MKKFLLEFKDGSKDMIESKNLEAMQKDYAGLHGEDKVCQLDSVTIVED